jgi:hypothetical protein
MRSDAPKQGRVARDDKLKQLRLAAAVTGSASEGGRVVEASFIVNKFYCRMYFRVVLPSHYIAFLCMYRHHYIVVIFASLLSPRRLSPCFIFIVFVFGVVWRSARVWGQMQ